jgi:hypothetical protein
MFFPTVRECVRPGMCARDDCLHPRVIYYLFIHMKASSFSFFFFVGGSTRQWRRNISRLIFFFASYTQDISPFLFIYKSAIRPYSLKWIANRSGSHAHTPLISMKKRGSTTITNFNLPKFAFCRFPWPKFEQDPMDDPTGPYIIKCHPRRSNGPLFSSTLSLYI